MNTLATNSLLIVALTCTSATARPLEIYSFEELRNKSDLVIICRLVRCGDHHDDKEPSFGPSYVDRRAVVEVESVLKGDTKQPKITMQFMREKTPEDNEDSPPSKGLKSLLRGSEGLPYSMAVIDDYPSRDKDSIDARDQSQKSVPHFPADWEISDKNRFYLLYLKQIDGGLYTPVTGPDSRQSIYELEYSASETHK